LILDASVHDVIEFIPDEETWQFSMLQWLLSIEVMMFVLCLVAVAAGLTVHQFITNVEPYWDLILGVICYLGDFFILDGSVALESGVGGPVRV
jgi:hypothetical protein